MSGRVLKIHVFLTSSGCRSVARQVLPPAAVHEAVHEWQVRSPHTLRIIAIYQCCVGITICSFLYMYILYVYAPYSYYVYQYLPPGETAAGIEPEIAQYPKST